MVFSKGFIYRWGQRIKDLGERMGHVRLFGIHICGHYIIGLGYAIKNSVMDSPIGEM